MRESAPALRGRVVVAVGTLAVLVYLIGAFRFHHGWWLGWGQVNYDSTAQADALIAVLLLVPGLLMARLDVARASSLVAVVRALPRFIAYVSVGCTAALAATVAGGAEGGAVYWSFFATVCLLAILFIVQFFDVTASRWARNSAFGLDVPLLPTWLVHPGARARTEAELDIDVRSDSGAMS
jgi:hypothetical protein